MKYINIICIVIIIIGIIIIISSEYMRLQGNNHMNMIEFYSSGRPLIAPYNILCSLCSKGSNVPFPNMDTHFPNHILLKNNWEIIRDEALHIYNTNQATQIKNDMFFMDIADEGWKKFYIKWYGPITEEAYKLCPETCKLINKLPEIKLAMFSILEPGSVIIPHTGPFKGCVRYHLGLDCPKDAYIIVDNIKYTWENGNDVLFDDTFMHEVYNKSDKPRIILFCDIERQMKNNLYQSINTFIINKLAPLTTRVNDKIEKKSKI